MKLITACIVIAALIIPQMVDKQKGKRKKSLKLRKRSVSDVTITRDL